MPQRPVGTLQGPLAGPMTSPACTPSGQPGEGLLPNLPPGPAVSCVLFRFQNTLIPFLLAELGWSSAPCLQAFQRCSPSRRDTCRLSTARGTATGRLLGPLILQGSIHPSLGTPSPWGRSLSAGLSSLCTPLLGTPTPGQSGPGFPSHLSSGTHHGVCSGPLSHGASGWLCSV